MDQLIDLNRLAELRDERPQSLMAYIRFAWPEIKAALDRGHTLKAVHQRLQECGINIGYRHLSSYVGRLRLQDRRAGMPAPAPERNTGVAESPAKAADIRESGSNDPLANVRERTRKRPGFNFSDEPADERDLI